MSARIAPLANKNSNMKNEEASFEDSRDAMHTDRKLYKADD